MLLKFVRVGLLATTAFVVASPAIAHVIPTGAVITDAPPAAAVAAAGIRIFTPSDFVRFAPKTVYDMLIQTPGFR